MEPVNPYAAPQVGESIEQARQPPITFLDVLRTGVDLYVGNLQNVVIVICIVWMPLELFQAYMDYFVLDPDDFRGSFRLSQFLENVFGIIATGGVIAIGAAAINGQRLGWWAALQKGFEAWPRMIWTRIVTGFCLVLALLCFVLPGLYLFLRLALTEPVVVVERLSGMGALKKSAALTQRAVLRMLGLVLVLLGTVFAVGVAVALPTVLLPEFDHWLLSAATSLLIDVFTGWATLTFVAAYAAELARASAALDVRTLPTNSIKLMTSPPPPPAS